MTEIQAIIEQVIALVYNRELLVFSIAATVFALLILLVDFGATKQFNKPSWFRISYENKPLQQFLIWGVGTIISAYIGGLVEFFNIESPLAMVIAGISWPTIVPRLIAQSLEDEQEDEQIVQEDEQAEQ